MNAASQGLDLFIVGAVPQEVNALRGWLSNLERVNAEWGTCWVGGVQRLRVGLASLGIGKVNAAAGSACLVMRFRPKMVWIVGSAGAYDDGPVEIRDVLISSTVFLGDEGVWEKGGIRSMEAVGIPVAEERGRPVFERFSFDGDELLRHLRQITPPGLYFADSRSFAIPRAVPSAGAFVGPTGDVSAPATKLFRVHFGPSVTVSLSSGDEWVAKERFSRYDAWAEDMEGSAVIQVCRRFGVSTAQCRGISNRAGMRDKSAWRTEEALAHCHAVVGTWLHAFREGLSITP